MVKLAFNTTIKYEYDSDTGKTRILSKWTTPIGQGTWQRKAKPKPINEIIEETEEEYL